jgi:hypothetical protein
MSKSKIIDLEVCDDGTYAQKESKPSKPSKTIGVNTKTINSKNNTDEFLGGIDIGLDLIENVIPRIGRFMKLRG